MRASASVKLMILAGVELAHAAQGRPPGLSSVADVDAVLAGRYDNAAQVARSKKTGEKPAAQHVTISIEPTQLEAWELWRIHMDVEPDVARAAGSDTALEAVWAMHVVMRADGEPLQFIPYSLMRSVDAGAVQALGFDQSQWTSVEACALDGAARGSGIVARVPADPMCVAVSMSLGGKRAFLPSRMEREGAWLNVDLIYFGKPWRVHARSMGMSPN